MKNYLVLVCILLLEVEVFSQQKINSCDLFTTQTTNYSIAKVNTNTDEKILVVENYSPDSCFYIMELIDDTILIDSVANALVRYIDKKKDTILYYPGIKSVSVFYTEDTLFVSFGNGFVTYIRRENHFEYSNCYYFNELSSDKRLSNIIGYKDNTLILGNQYFNGDKFYTVAVYDIKQKSITKKIEIPANNSIILHYYDIYNVFSSNNNYISVINTIKPEIQLYDYNLNLIDTIDFALNNDYKITQKLLDTNIYVNKDVISPYAPKTIIKILDDINILNYYSNTKHTFVDDTTLIVLTNRMNVDSCDVVKVNVKTHNKEVLFTYPKYGIESPYTALNLTSNVPVFSKGLFIDYNIKMDSLEENIIYFMDIYYSSLLDFTQKIITLEDKKQNIVDVNIKEYDGIIVFDEYFCKECFVANNKYKKLLFIYYDSKMDKMNRLSIYKELKKIYPNSSVFFNHNNKFDLKYNQMNLSL